VPPHDAPLTGPAVVVGRTVVAPTAGGLIQLDVQDGKPRTTHAVVSFKEVMETAGGRAVVDAAGAGKAFGAEER
jgi:hypothetical protein